MQRWHAAQSGATAIEFGMVALPFVLLLFGILSVCLYFFTTFTLENAVWHAARAIRTGQVQQSQGDYAAATTNDDRTKLCKQDDVRQGAELLHCLGKAVAIFQRDANFGSIDEPKCGRGDGGGGCGRL